MSGSPGSHTGDILHGRKYYGKSDLEQDKPFGDWRPTDVSVMKRVNCNDSIYKSVSAVQDNKAFAPDMERAKDMFEKMMERCIGGPLCKVTMQYIRPEDFLKGCPPLCSGYETALDTPEFNFNLEGTVYRRIADRYRNHQEVDPVWLDKTDLWPYQPNPSCPVWCHEGRHRAMVALKEGISLIPAIVIEPDIEAQRVFHDKCLIEKRRFGLNAKPTSPL